MVVWRPLTHQPNAQPNQGDRQEAEELPLPHTRWLVPLISVLRFPEVRAPESADTMIHVNQVVPWFDLSQAL